MHVITLVGGTFLGVLVPLGRLYLEFDRSAKVDEGDVEDDR